MRASSILDIKSCREASSDSDHFLFRGKYRCKIAYNKQELNRKTKKLNIDALREPSAVTKFQQQQLVKEFGKPETEQAVKGKIVWRKNEAIKRGNNRSSRTNNRISTKTR
jgi:hypothetical protein